MSGHPLPVAAASVNSGPSVCTAKWVPSMNPSTTTKTVNRANPSVTVCRVANNNQLASDVPSGIKYSPTGLSHM